MNGKKKPTSVLIRPPRISHEITGDKSLAIAERNQRLAAWAISRRNIVYSLSIINMEYRSRIIIWAVYVESAKKEKHTAIIFMFEE
jgi:hypothetical protein